jgi:hypothetical protein
MSVTDLTKNRRLGALEFFISYLKPTPEMKTLPLNLASQCYTGFSTFDK